MGRNAREIRTRHIVPGFYKLSLWDIGAGLYAGFDGYPEGDCGLLARAPALTGSPTAPATCPAGGGLGAMPGELATKRAGLFSGKSISRGSGSASGGRAGGSPSAPGSRFHRRHGSPPSWLKLPMTAVAHRRRGGVLALAPADRDRLGALESHRLQARALVAAVAERRVRGTPAGAPEMNAGLDFED